MGGDASVSTLTLAYHTPKDGEFHGASASVSFIPVSVHLATLRPFFPVFQRLLAPNIGCHDSVSEPIPAYHTPKDGGFHGASASTGFICVRFHLAKLWPFYRLRVSTLSFNLLTRCLGPVESTGLDLAVGFWRETLNFYSNRTYDTSKDGEFHGASSSAGLLSLSLRLFKLSSFPCRIADAAGRCSRRGRVASLSGDQESQIRAFQERLSCLVMFRFPTRP